MIGRLPQKRLWIANGRGKSNSVRWILRTHFTLLAIMNFPTSPKNGGLEMSIEFEKFIRRHRVFPRAILLFFVWHMAKVIDWIILLPDPTPSQAGIVAAVGAVFGGVVKFYQESGKSEVEQ